MTGRRDQLRDAELSDPRTSARTLNDIIRDLQTRLEALEKTRFADLQMTTDAGSTMSSMLIPVPTWPVKAVYLARAWNATTNAPFWPARFGWQIAAGGIEATLWVGDVSPSTTYQLRFEVRG